jgi:hypothetical protein
MQFAGALLTVVGVAEVCGAWATGYWLQQTASSIPSNNAQGGIRGGGPRESKAAALRLMPLAGWLDTMQVDLATLLLYVIMMTI